MSKSCQEATHEELSLQTQEELYQGTLVLGLGACTLAALTNVLTIPDEASAEAGDDFGVADCCPEPSGNASPMEAEHCESAPATRS